ncbi:MAG: GTP cyclohydrolase I FolE [Bdellovibrionales bacterium]|nr:GTP cyclohydrolase I FolE [Bdellovibrionales bacterium]
MHKGNGALRAEISTNLAADQASQHREIAELCSRLLHLIGEDPTRQGLQRTPQRYAKALAELTGGYRQDILEIINDAIYDEKYSEMVVVKEIEFFSICEHHILPFFGKAHVAYVPNGKIIGLSKIPRIVNMFARRLQVQERLTDQIVAAIDQALHPLGVACIIEAKHMCMMMRGVESKCSSMTTNAMRGSFLSDQRTRAEFLSLVNSRN